MMQGTNLEDVTRGIDETMIRQPLGVVAAITPFNFLAMIPFCFLPYAIACGNTLILKPSERVPLTMRRVMDLIQKTGLPKGVVNLLHGVAPSSMGFCDHRQIRAISFVGSTPVAKSVVRPRRSQWEEDAMPGRRQESCARASRCGYEPGDANRCGPCLRKCRPTLPCSLRRHHRWRCRGDFRDSLSAVASSLKVGSGLDDGIQMGPVISKDSKKRILSLVGMGVREGAIPILDGRDAEISNKAEGNFPSPTILDGLPSSSQLAHTEIFGPVLSLVHAKSIDEAMEFLRQSPYGNQASIFTTSGAAARKFR
jgi:malonate-semialdehyde dehydrogenase (acetylating)/methylmalonate-semialdehyde dehydrogenase